MIITSVKEFDKNFSKLPKKIQGKFYWRMEVFKKDISDKSLNNHKLSGEYEGCNSINITGNYRAIYTVSNKEVYIFITIGTHPELYG